MHTLGAGRFNRFTRRAWESSLVHYMRHLICFIMILKSFLFQSYLNTIQIFVNPQGAEFLEERELGENKSFTRQ